MNEPQAWGVLERFFMRPETLPESHTDEQHDEATAAMAVLWAAKEKRPGEVVLAVSSKTVVHELIHGELGHSVELRFDVIGARVYQGGCKHPSQLGFVVNAGETKDDQGVARLLSFELGQSYRLTLVQDPNDRVTDG